MVLLVENPQGWLTKRLGKKTPWIMLWCDLSFWGVCRKLWEFNCKVQSHEEKKCGYLLIVIYVYVVRSITSVMKIKSVKENKSKAPRWQRVNKTKHSKNQHGCIYVPTYLCNSYCRKGNNLLVCFLWHFAGNSRGWKKQFSRWFIILLVIVRILRLH